MIRTTLLLAAATALLPAVAHAQDPCSLLTPDQIKAVLNSPVEPGQPGAAKDSNECTWSNARGVDRVFVALRSGADFQTTRAKIAKAGLNPMAAPGIGEDAFFVCADTTTCALYALAKNHFLLLTVYATDDGPQDIQAAEKTLAAQILPKL